MSSNKKMGPVECLLCGKIFKTYGSLHVHRGKKHPEHVRKRPSTGPITCPGANCSWTCSEHRRLTDHLKRRHPRLHLEIKLQKEVAGEARYFCRSCGLVFQTRSDLLGHRRRDHMNDNGEKSEYTIACPVDDCYWFCAENKRLTQHLKRTHPDYYESRLDLRYVCPLCEERFPTIDFLRKHYREAENKQVGHKVFANEDEYLIWLNNVEMNQKTAFKQSSQTHMKQVKGGNYSTIRRFCRQSGYIERKGLMSPAVAPGQKMSMKVNHICSAYLKEKRYRSGRIEVEYCTDHTHKLHDFRKLPASEDIEVEKRRVMKLQGQTHKRHRLAVLEYGQGRNEVREVERDKVWLVESGNSCNLVQFNEACRCDPLVRCRNCGVCFHNYICDCSEGQGTGYSCKHVHAVRIIQLETSGTRYDPSGYSEIVRRNRPDTEQQEPAPLLDHYLEDDGHFTDTICNRDNINDEVEDDYDYDYNDEEDYYEDVEVEDEKMDSSEVTREGGKTELAVERRARLIRDSDNNVIAGAVDDEIEGEGERGQEERVVVDDDASFQVQYYTSVDQQQQQRSVLAGAGEIKEAKEETTPEGHDYGKRKMMSGQPVEHEPEYVQPGYGNNNNGLLVEEDPDSYTIREGQNRGEIYTGRRLINEPDIEVERRCLKEMLMDIWERLDYCEATFPWDKTVNEVQTIRESVTASSQYTIDILESECSSTAGRRSHLIPNRPDPFTVLAMRRESQRRKEERGAATIAKLLKLNEIEENKELDSLRRSCRLRRVKQVPDQ